LSKKDPPNANYLALCSVVLASPFQPSNWGSLLTKLAIAAALAAMFGCPLALLPVARGSALLLLFGWDPLITTPLLVLFMPTAFCWGPLTVEYRRPGPLGFIGD